MSQKYKFFSLGIKDEKLDKLSEKDLSILASEAQEEHLRLEREIDNLVWPDNPQLTPEGHPANLIWPSEFSYLPALYKEEIEKDPALERRLEKADQLTKQVGLVLAVYGTVRILQARNAAEKDTFTKTQGD